MGYGGRAVELLCKYYQGEIVSLDERTKKPEDDTNDAEEEDQEEGMLLCV